MGQLPGPEPNYAQLFAEPSIQRMLDELSDHEFEHFVKYVFEQAGYFVEDTANHNVSGLDLRVYMGPVANGVLKAGVQIKHWVEGHKITTHEVTHLRGGLPGLDGVVGYFVTTSTFQPTALDEAKNGRRIWPINGSHLIRYINYVRGSRPSASLDGDGKSSPLALSFTPIPPDAFFEADAVPWRSPKQTKIVVLANHKGGVGKTTTALNLAFGLAGKDYKQRVLLVDMDAQANVTRELSSPHEHAAQKHLGDYFAGRHTLAQLVRPTRFEGVWLIPSDHDLTLSDSGVAAGPTAELRFARDLHGADVVPPQIMEERPFDWIIIDTGPSMGFFTRSALAASHYIIMPVAPGVFADVGVGLLRRTIDTMAALTGRTITLLGGVITQWQGNALNSQLVTIVEHSLRIIGEKIPFDRNNIEKAHLETGAGKKKTIFDRKCPAARAYTDVVARVVEEVTQHVQSCGGVAE